MPSRLEPDGAGPDAAHTHRDVVGNSGGRVLGPGQEATRKDYGVLVGDATGEQPGTYSRERSAVNTGTARRGSRPRDQATFAVQVLQSP